MKLSMLLILVILSTGCAISVPVLERDAFLLTITVTEDMPSSSVKAYAEWGEGWCHVYIKPTTYMSNNCLGHELRHCTEGQWHGSLPKDC